MACPALTFQGITPEHFASIAAEVKTETGIAVSGNSGTASKMGFTVTWNYDPSDGSLTIQCTDKPWLCPASTVQSRITELVEGHQ